MLSIYVFKALAAGQLRKATLLQRALRHLEMYS